MRYNLKVPYAQKDAAKELGARWDAGHKLWYVVDPADLELFSDWMPQPQGATAAPARTATPAPARVSADQQRGVITGAATYTPLCQCDVLPWEHCPHTEPSCATP